MKNFAWLVVGIVAGFTIAHQVNKTMRGNEFFGEVDGRIKELTDTFTDAYNKRDAELKARGTEY